jgi:hypothetical protein
MHCVTYFWMFILQYFSFNSTGCLFLYRAYVLIIPSFDIPSERTKYLQYFMHFFRVSDLVAIQVLARFLRCHVTTSVLYPLPKPTSPLRWKHRPSYVIQKTVLFLVLTPCWNIHRTNSKTYIFFGRIRFFGLYFFFICSCFHLTPPFAQNYLLLQSPRHLFCGTWSPLPVESTSFLAVESNSPDIYIYIYIYIYLSGELYVFKRAVLSQGLI